MIFGKSKNDIYKSTQSEVFDIMKVGGNISKLRKAAGMTQTELADRLNVSFQAVSNWERGQSCPDIANLMELASLFKVSVDRILGSERAAELVTDISEDRAPKMSAAEIEKIAPILDETQADSVVRKNLLNEDGQTSEESIGEFCEEYESLYSIPTSLLPFLSDDLIDELASDAVRTGGINAIPGGWLPFIDDDVLGEIAEDIMKKDGINAIPDEWLPFIDDDWLVEQAKALVEKNGKDALPSSWLPFIDDDALGEIAKEIMEKGGINAIPDEWLPFIDDDWLGEQAKALVEKNGKDALPSSWLPFIDDDALGEIAKEIMEKGGFKAVPEEWYPFIDEDIFNDYIRKHLRKK